MDLGPYAVATAIELFGPVANVTALATMPRTAGVTLDGAEFPIAEPTRVAGVLAHESGVLTTITTTDDANGPARYGVEVHGLDGTLLGGDPNTFDGPVILARRGEPDQTLPLVSQWKRQLARARPAGPLPRRPRRHAAARERRARPAGRRGRCWRCATTR